MALRDIFAMFDVRVRQDELIEAQKNVNKLINTFSALQRVATFALGAIGIGKLADSADEYITLENKLKAVTNGTAEFIAAQKGVERIAEDLAVPVSKIADSFLRYKLATESLNASQEETIDFTKRVTQAMILSGATSEEAHRASIQLAQGFGKNFKAAAQDLKSVKEQAPVLARLIEKAVGGTPGTLLQLAHEGRISSKIVFDAVRAAGEQLDRDFAKRQKTFATIGDMMGDVWLQLMKRLKPVFVPIIAALERMVHWTREWVADGSAMNAVVAGAITAVGALAYVFGGLALSVAAAAAPFVALFLALDELVAFIRGDESFLEDFLVNAFGKEKTEQIRNSINELITLVGRFFAALGSGPEMDMAAWRLSRAFTTAMKAAWDEIAEYGMLKMRETLGDTTADLFGIRKPGESERDAAMDQVMRLKQNQDTPDTAPDWSPIGAEPERAPVMRYFQIPETARPYVPLGRESILGRSPNGYAAPPQITNNITVQGNADAPVARDIATRTGNATADALGRDRSAVGAGFGLTP
jgi:tape measure domain-containing protein